MDAEAVVREATLDEIVGQVAQRAGIDQAQARTAVETVLGFLKQRLPAPLADQLDGVLGGGDGGGQAQDLEVWAGC